MNKIKKDFLIYNYIKHILFFLLFCSAFLLAQNSLSTISGFVYDNSTGEELIGANILVEKIGSGTASNVYGFYSISLPKGRYKLKVSYVGYENQIREIELNKSKSINFSLNPKSVTVEEVIVEGNRSDENIKSAQMGISEVTPKEISSVPIILGEQDILKTIQLMPGVSPAGEGNSGFFVRGGQVDQNLILLDEATVYNASHLMGFFSVFNSDAIKNATLIKGSSPPEYGGRLSSVLDIKMKEGNKHKYQFNGGIGLISSRLAIQGPIKKDVGSFIISGRRTYADLFLFLSSDENVKNSTLYFYDLNLKANYMLGKKDRIFLSGYFGRDIFNFSNQFGFDWGNITSTLRWNHLFSDKLFSNTSLIYSKYDYTVSVEDGDALTGISSSVEDINLKSDYQFYLNPSNTFKFGLNGYYHIFNPGVVTAEGKSILNSAQIQKTHALEIAIYLAHEFKLNKRLSFNYGLRFSTFTILGPKTVYTFDKYQNIVDQKYFKSGELVKSYNYLEPRFSSNYLLNEVSSIKASYSRNSQYLHLLSTSTTSTPLDVWQPSTSIVKPEIADQYSIGYFRNFMKNDFESSIEVYYKNMQNQVEYVNGADIILNEYVESQLTFGKGWSYGMEFSLKKNTGRLTGWLSYTLSKTQRQFDDINNGSPFSARQDRTHDFSITGIYKLNERWTFSANWIYYTGDAVTYPSGKYQIDGNTINLYTERNESRMPDYHRLDIGATWIISKSFDSEMSLTFSIYNVYGRKNAYSIKFRENEYNPQITEAVKLSLFSVVPSITFNFNF